MADKAWPDRAQGAIRRYRVAAWVTGTMLLVLTAHVIMQFVQFSGPLDLGAVFDQPGLSVLVPRAGIWVPAAHGWIYVAYLVTVLDLWSTMRWGYGRLVAMVLAGVVPVMSFILERRVHAQGLAQVSLGRPAERRTPQPARRSPH